MMDVKKQFIEYLLDTRKVSDNTLQSYVRDFDQYLTYLSAKNIKIFSVTEDQIKKMLHNMEASGLSKATLSRMIATIRCFYRFAVLEGMTDYNPALNVKINKDEKKLPEILTAKEIELFLSQPDITDLKGCRDKAMLELLYATGIRVSELIDLNIDDINLQLGVLYCRGKKSERMIPIYDDAKNAVADYIKRVRSAVILDYREPALFTNMNGSRMTRQGFWKIVKSYTKSAKINKDITPHTL
ncbi:MAG: tyrosine-type recombinase/integrase, partial [Clostridia bacterium]|nr:tyrosine-type recombinase/integrase [Clostridia bacterium]